MHPKTPRKRIHDIIRAEVLAEELARRHDPPFKHRLDISTALARRDIAREAAAVFTKADRERAAIIIRIRIRDWEEEERKRAQPNAWKHY